MANDQAAPMKSALPPAVARMLAMAAIVIAGVCGGLIGWKVADLQIDGDSQLWPGIIGLAGAIAGAGGVAVVSVLVLRAMAEWNTMVEAGDPSAARKEPRRS